ncbi:5-methylcytosine-specific restriction enzyme subunit McrC [Runella defluvii]|uniref:5-methylcytosine-specific restriction enzyme subunit McrC n=1 Tax=Runella defluvii TaxID=370973 RepID=A0A7W5ZHM4_9BACT|nr:McrC family protein [Runella defluvii]MBB3837305.1 5-methylcytosine-specific restriction enzyme subunit McrC [Runella defluvii]
MPQHFTITEHGYIRRLSTALRKEQTDTLSAIFVSDSTFELLKQLSFQANTDPLLTYSVQKGGEFIRIKNYVGVLQLADRTQIEILPKIALHTQLPEMRLALLRMLRTVPELPFHRLSQAQLQQAHLPVWEIFISAFIAEIEQLTRQGIQKSYETVEEQSRFLKGKWQYHRQNHAHPELLAVEHDQFIADILPNRLLKTCIEFLAKRSHYLPNQAKLRKLRFIWDEIQPSSTLTEDFQKAQHLARSFDRYTQALKWAKILLMNQSWSTFGKNTNESLLFPTEQLFERYVAQGFKRYCQEYEVVYQETAHYLLQRHDGKPQFKLRPDLVLRLHKHVIVIDIKWKRISPEAPNYGIDQADLYQLYAYGQKYRATELYLLYPAHESFTTPLPAFRFDDALQLIILPFDITQPLSTAIGTVRAIIDHQTNTPMS